MFIISFIYKEKCEKKNNIKNTCQPQEFFHHTFLKICLMK